MIFLLKHFNLLYRATYESEGLHVDVSFVTKEVSHLIKLVCHEGKHRKITHTNHFNISYSLLGESRMGELHGLTLKGKRVDTFPFFSTNFSHSISKERTVSKVWHWQQRISKRSLPGLWHTHRNTHFRHRSQHAWDGLVSSPHWTYLAFPLQDECSPQQRIK